MPADKGRGNVVAVATAVTPPPLRNERPDQARAADQRAGDVVLRGLPKLRRAYLPAAAAAGTAVVLAGIIARFLAPNGLWLDEALSVNIAKLPLTQMPGALVQDGSPPLYYVLLHVWMLVFGQGELAVRSMSAIVSVATLPLLWYAGLRAGGRRVAWAALLLAAT